MIKRTVNGFTGIGMWLAMLVTPAAMAIDYQLETCCDLCPAAADASSYNTSYLEIFEILEQGKDGWLYRSNKDFMEAFDPGEEGYDGLKAITRDLLSLGVRLVLVKPPTRGLTHPENIEGNTSFNWDKARSNYLAMHERFRSIGIITPDMSDLLPYKNEGEFFFRRDHHWTPFGARETAMRAAEAIRKLPEYHLIDPVTFRTITDGLIEKDGTLQRAASRICGFDYPNQYVPRFGAEQVMTEADTDDAALFGDESFPEIVLVGTSNSKGETDYNFAGFLRDALDRDVLNEAMAGGSYDGALMQYLLSEEFRSNPPRILVWEVPAYERLTNSRFYRQVKPMVTNGCLTREVQLEETKQLNPGRNELMFNGGGEIAPLKSGQLILDLQFDNPSVKSADLTIWYLSGKREKIQLKIPRRANSNGRFMVELNNDETYFDQTYLGTDITISGKDPGATPTAVKAMLCTK